MITTRKAMYLNPQVIEKAGKKEFVVLPYEEYQAIEEMMDDYRDLIDLIEKHKLKLKINPL
jgi:PHD/YefM family antitoxin component YafN of YafNO toxin-antitoxin module